MLLQPSYHTVIATVVLFGCVCSSETNNACVGCLCLPVLVGRSHVGDRCLSLYQVFMYGTTSVWVTAGVDVVVGAKDTLWTPCMTYISIGDVRMLCCWRLIAGPWSSCPDCTTDCITDCSLTASLHD